MRARACVEPPAEPEAGQAQSALGAGEQCDRLTADKSFPNGDPHLYLASQSYTRVGCTDAYLVDVSYQDPAPLPGTYLSWADAEPTEAACPFARLRVFVWDTTTSTPVLKGSLTSQGVWGTNPDPAANPGATGVCQIDPIRIESGISLTPGRKYRFAVRAAVERSGIFKRHLVLANAPLPGRKGPGAVGQFVGGWYMAVLASSGANMLTADPWPTSSFAVRLRAMDARVTRGGDLLFQGGFFFKPAKSYTKSADPNFGLSNANLLYMGKDLDLNGFTCPTFAATSSSVMPPEYTYPPGGFEPSVAAGKVYCVVDARNEQVDRVKVIRADPAAAQLLVIGFAFDRLTGLTTWNCLDGFCDSEVKLAVQDTWPTAAERGLVATTFDLVHQAKACIEGYLQRTLPVPLGMAIHADTDGTPLPLGGTSFGNVTDVVNVRGFQGIIRPGHHRVDDEEDLRFELHETMHLYNYHLFNHAILPNWFNEGMSIQLEARDDCGGNPRLLRNSWVPWQKGDKDGHPVGSELFRRLEEDYGCDMNCAGDIWRALVDAHVGAEPLTAAQIKAAMEARVGVDLSGLLSYLEIAY